MLNKTLFLEHLAAKFHSGEITLADIAGTVGEHPDMVNQGLVQQQRWFVKTALSHLQTGQNLDVPKAIESLLPVVR